MTYPVLKQLFFTGFDSKVMSNFRTTLNLIVCKVMTGNHICREFLIKMQGLKPCNYIQMILRHRYFPVNFAQFQRKPICRTFAKGLVQFFLKFYFFLCEELHDNEDHRFSNCVNVNGLLFIKIKLYVHSIVFIAFST